VNSRKIAAAVVAAVALSAVPSAASGVDTFAPPTYKRYSTCTTLHKDYPRGIAHSKYRVSKGSKYVWSKVNGTKRKYRPSLISDKAYNAQSRVRDRDRDYVACELSGW
jgi:hypothetical protein